MAETHEPNMADDFYGTADALALVVAEKVRALHQQLQDIRLNEQHSGWGCPEDELTTNNLLKAGDVVFMRPLTLRAYMQSDAYAALQDEARADGYSFEFVVNVEAALDGVMALNAIADDGSICLEQVILTLAFGVTLLENEPV